LTPNSKFLPESFSMPERHALTDAHCKRIRNYEEIELPSLRRKKRARALFRDLDVAFGDELEIILTTRPTNSIGRWRIPTEKQVKRARKLILWRIVTYCRHDPTERLTAEEVGQELRSLHSRVLDASNGLSSLHKDTRHQIKRLDSDAPKSLGKLSDRIRAGEKLIRELSERFEPPQHQYDHSPAEKAFDFIVLVYLQTTGAYPATSPPVRKAENEPREPPNRRSLTLQAIELPADEFAAYSKSAPLYRIVRRAVDAYALAQSLKPNDVETALKAKRKLRQKDTALKAAMLTSTVALLRPQTLQPEN
jgi:hypothetical protein